MPCIALGRDDFAFYPTDCSVMPFLRILCPIKKKSFATSVETSVQHKVSLPNIIKFSYCPYCYTLHAWTPDEAFFDDLEHEASEHEACTAATSAGSNGTNVARRPKNKPQLATAGADGRKITRSRGFRVPP
jgi:hypothetical protein